MVAVLRSFRRAPAFTLAVVALLALTAAAVGAVMAVVDALLLRPLPYRDAHRLVTIMSATQSSCGTSCPDLLAPDELGAIRAQAHSLSTVASFLWREFALTGAGQTRTVAGAAVDPALFSLLGTTPTAGRTLTLGDAAAGAPPAAVVSLTLGKRLFGSLTKSLGASVTLDGRTYTVVGIMPEAFRYPEGADVWVPLGTLPPASEDGRVFGAVARLNPTATITRAQSELAVIARRVMTPGIGPQGIAATSLEATARTAGQAADLPLLTVALLILVALGALQTLFIVRTVGKIRELAIRTALGASRTTLLRSLLAEQLWLGVAASVIGLVALAWIITGVAAWLPLIGITLPLSLSFRAVGATVATVFGLLLLVSFTPIVSVVSRAQSQPIRAAGGNASAPKQAVALRRLVIGMDIGVAFGLLTVTIIMARALIQVGRIDMGYDSWHLITTPIDLPRTEASAQESQAVSERLIAMTSALPGVTATAVWSVAGPSMMVKPGEPMLTIEGSTVKLTVDCRRYSDCSFPLADYRVSPNFFTAMGIPIVRGRGFSAEDRAGTASVAIVSEQGARHWWPGQDPIGKRFRIGGPSSPFPWMTVIGVAANVHPVDELGLTHASLQPHDYFSVFYQPLAQARLDGSGQPVWTGSLLLGVRHTGALANPDRALRPLIQQIAPAATIGTIESLANKQTHDFMFTQLRLRAHLLTAWAGLTLVLALVGVAGLVGEEIRARFREFGIRIALGAAPHQIRRSALGDTMRLGVGAVAAAIGGWILLRPLLREWLLGTSNRWQERLLDTWTPREMPVLVAALLGLAFTMMLAAWGATRPLVRLDPASALRQE